MFEFLMFLPIVFFALAIFISYRVKNNTQELKDNYEKNSNYENLEQHTYDNVDYLGGHPLFNDGMKKGLIYIDNKRIAYARPAGTSKPIFEIPIKDITNCSVETKKSLTATRIALTGLLAWGLKKKNKYIRITFKNQLNESDDIIFQSNKFTGRIVNKINKMRMEETNKNVDLEQEVNSKVEKMN